MDRMRTMSRWIAESGKLGAMLGLILTGTATGQAETPVLQADIQPLAIRSRTAAPAFVDIKLRSRQRAILEGRYELEILTGDRLLFRQRTHELVLAPGENTQRVLLPSATTESGMNLNIHLRFLSKHGFYDLGRFPISGESQYGRDYLIGVIGTSSPLAPDRVRLWQALRPEWTFPERPGEFRRIASVPVWLPPEDLPKAIGLCAFDVVAVEGRAFTALDEQQLAELTAWVKGGGSLCVAPSGPLSPAHLAFLNTLAGSPEGVPAVVAEPDGTLVLRGGSPLLVQPGIGRAVITVTSPASEAEITAPAWKTIPGFLAKARVEYAEKYGLNSFANPQGNYRNAQENREFLAQRALLAELPQTSRMIPLPVIGALLGVFVLAVGPGEWLLLGWLRRRRWTWMTFPLLAISCSWLTVRVAEYYLGRSDQLLALLVTDLDNEGKTIRENQLTVRIPGRKSVATSEFRQSLAVSTGRARGIYGANPIPLYEGSLPGHYTISETLAQWQPAMQRTLSFAARTPPANIPWEIVNLRTLTAGPQASDYQAMAQKFVAQGWSLQVCHQGSRDFAGPVNNNGDWLTPLSTLQESDRAWWAAALSPSGRADLADLALHDPSDPHEWLVVALRSSKSTIHLVRRLYRQP